MINSVIDGQVDLKSLATAEYARACAEAEAASVRAAFWRKLLGAREAVQFLDEHRANVAIEPGDV